MSVRLLVFEPLIISQLTHRGIHLLLSPFTFSYMLRGALFSAYLLRFSTCYSVTFTFLYMHRRIAMAFIEKIIKKD